jgi:hypothetical protein
MIRPITPTAHTKIQWFGGLIDEIVFRQKDELKLKKDSLDLAIQQDMHLGKKLRFSHFEKLE